MPSGFERTYGFPRESVTLATWRQRPWNRWAFRHVSELVPSAVITANTTTPLPPVPESAAQLARPAFPQTSETLAEFLHRSETDSLLVMRNAEPVLEWHAPDIDRHDAHLIFSITKSLTALVAGQLEQEGLLDTASPVARYIPEAAGSAYEDATLRDLLDMRVSLDFEESYLSDGDYAAYRRAMLWNPAEPTREDRGLLALLCTLRKGPHAHGGVHTYQSPNTDMLGAVIERVTGERFAPLLSRMIWSPLGASADAFITVDRFGAPRTAGGMSCRPHDLARLGQMLLDGGVANGKRLVSESWLSDMRENGDPDVWARGSQADFLANGRYRSQWYQFGGASKVFLAAGIHGQFLWCDPESRTVIVKFASQNLPQDDALDQENIKLFQALSQR